METVQKISLTDPPDELSKKINLLAHFYEYFKNREIKGVWTNGKVQANDFFLKDHIEFKGMFNGENPKPSRSNFKIECEYDKGDAVNVYVQ